MIGDASLVALSEAVHCGAQPLAFRNRLLQYLVQEKDFTAIAIESGIVESRVAYDYVRGSTNDLDAAVAGGIGWTLDRMPQNRELVRWLRTAVVADLITLIECRERRYAAASTAADYAWAHRAAIGARQVDAWLRQVPVGWRPVEEAAEPRSEQVQFFPVATNVRDRAQADNLDWIVEQEGAGGKILLFAARYHMSTVPLRSDFGHQGGPEHQQEVAGTYLRRRFAERLLTICNVMGQAKTEAEPTVQCPPPHSVDGMAAEVGLPLFVLDLRAAPAPLKQWLDQEQSLAYGSHLVKLPLQRAFDLLLYIDAVTPAAGLATPALRT